MPDITMCTGDGCPWKEQCYRHTAAPTPLWQSYFVKPPIKDGRCDHYWEVEEKHVRSRSGSRQP